MLEYVACRQFWGVLAKIGNATQNERHVGNMSATYHAMTAAVADGWRYPCSDNKDAIHHLYSYMQPCYSRYFSGSDASTLAIVAPVARASVQPL
jgi:hypothetical protein